MARPAEPKPVRDATTVLLLRPADGIDGTDPFEVFMVRRTAKAAFMASAMVFPGGRLDDDDAADAIAARCDLSRDEAAARLGMSDGARALGLLVAGVRETFEEAGVLLARRRGAPIDLADAAGAARFAAHRDALNGGAARFADIAEAEDLTLDVRALSLYARWITPPIESRRFDARFLLARAPSGQRPLHDAVETTASAWLAPRAALSAYEAGEIQLAPPTLRVLLELARFEGIAPALASCRGRVPAPVQPQPHHADGELHLLLPGDPAFDPPGDRPNRITLRDGRWHSLGRGA